MSVAFLAFASLIAPVYISPLFNKYTRLQNARIEDPILNLARANGIPASDVYEFDASRQSNRGSANVSGFAGTMRISLTDKLLRRCTLAHIETTMGHEMGHYVLNHSYKGLILNGLVIVIAFAFASWGIGFALAQLWRSMGRTRRCWRGGAAAGGDRVFHLFLSDHARGEHHHPDHGVRGRICMA